MIKFADDKKEKIAKPIQLYNERKINERAISIQKYYVERTNKDQKSNLIPRMSCSLSVFLSFSRHSNDDILQFI